MAHRSFSLRFAQTFALGAACALGSTASTSNAEPATSMENPILRPWTGPFGGVPDFSKVAVEDFVPGLEAGMASQLAEFDAIANDPNPPTFDNTIAALEKSGQPLGRAFAFYGIWSSNLSTPEFRKVEAQMAPKLSEFSDKLYQNTKLFERIKAVYGARESLNPEQQRLAWYLEDSFRRNGAALNAVQKKQLAALNKELANLYTKFSQHLLGDEDDLAFVVEKESELAGMSKGQIEAAAAEAKRRKMPGKFAFSNTRSAIEPLLTFADNRNVRERAFKLWTSRGDGANKNNNNATIVQILKLRLQKAKLLGYPTFADWRMSNTMAKKPQLALDLLMKVWAPGVKAFKRDLADAQVVVIAEGGKFKIAAWDYRYYAEKVRKQKYDLDLNELRPYLELTKFRDAMFWEANALYGMTFTKVDNVPVFQSDMSVYEVKRNGKFIGLWYFDPYARPGKRSGAWMNSYRDQQRLIGDIPTIVSNNSNFVKPGPGERSTISWDDAKTMFHEFGHALHGLASNVTYPTLSGTNTTRDFVEFPSQFNENFLLTPEVLKFLVNEKGEKIPEGLLKRLHAASTFGEGFAVVETLSSAIIDMKIHTADPNKVAPKAFEKATLKQIGMPPEVVLRHRLPGFAHIFSDEGYAAGYYSYCWSETLAADAYEAFASAKGGPYDKSVSTKFYDTILSVGNTVDPAQAYRNFRGRDPDPAALLRQRGFIQ